MAGNKIEYGLCNAYYAPCTYDIETQTYTYDTPIPLPGAKNVSFSASGDSNPFYADNIVYFDTKTNAGYEGDFELAVIPDSFRIDILGEEKANGMLIENADAQGKEFALMFQFDGDKSNRRHIMYRCSATRPDIASQTKESSTEPNTSKLSLKCMARENDHVVKASLLESENPEKFGSWFDSVQEPPEVFTVTLNANGGTIAEGKNVTRYTKGVGAVLPTNAQITKEDNTFGGWFTNEACTGTAVTSISAEDMGNKVFYAKWTAT